MLQLRLNYFIKIITILLIGTSNFVLGQDLKNYQFINQKGEKVNYSKVINELKKYDVILFGEHHNNSTNHWLQLQVAKSLHDSFGNKLIIGGEMFERDQQDILNHYLKSMITEKEMMSSIKLWSNYLTDYKPLIEFSKINKLRFVATNIPRRYATIVAKEGVDKLNSLPENEKQWMVKLPFPIDFNAPGYPEMIEMIGEHAGVKAKQFVLAQAIKDATMAVSILNNRKKGQIFYHINGDYHSKNFGGIYWYLKLLNPKINIAVIQILESNNRELNFKKENIKNFIFTQFTLVLPEDTIKTY